MAKQYLTTIKVLISIVVLFTSCSSDHKPKDAASTAPSSVGTVLTAESRNNLTPDSILSEFKKGNESFVSNKLTNFNFPEQVKNSAGGQYPKAFILSCIDSRVPVEDVLNQGIGDVFVGRVAGNIVDDELLASMEYACLVAGAKVIVVMGHESCGAIKTAIEKPKVSENIDELIEKIEPAVKVSSNFPGEKTVKNHDYVDDVCKNNVLNTIEDIKKGSSILNKMHTENQIKIVGAYYDLDTGKLSFIN